MSLRKISIDNHGVIKQSRIQNKNWSVSAQVEEFDCGAKAIWVYREGEFGISKKEYKVSNRHLANGFLGMFNGG